MNDVTLIAWLDQAWAEIRDGFLRDAVEMRIMKLSVSLSSLAVDRWGPSIGRTFEREADLKDGPDRA